MFKAKRSKISDNVLSAMKIVPRHYFFEPSNYHGNLNDFITMSYNVNKLRTDNDRVSILRTLMIRLDDSANPFIQMTPTVLEMLEVPGSESRPPLKWQNTGVISSSLYPGVDRKIFFL